MWRTFWVVGCGFAFLGVAAGAFGAHALRGTRTAELVAVFETGVRYHMYHSLALLAVALLLQRVSSRSGWLAGWLFALGITIFSGSLYLLTLTGTGWFGAVTPVGGVLLLGGWVALALAARSLLVNQRQGDRAAEQRSPGSVG